MWLKDNEALWPLSLSLIHSSKRSVRVRSQILALYYPKTSAKTTRAANSDPTAAPDCRWPRASRPRDTSWTWTRRGHQRPRRRANCGRPRRPRRRARPPGWCGCPGTSTAAASLASNSSRPRGSPGTGRSPRWCRILSRVRGSRRRGRTAPWLRKPASRTRAPSSPRKPPPTPPPGPGSPPSFWGPPCAGLRGGEPFADPPPLQRRNPPTARARIRIWPRKGPSRCRFYLNKPPSSWSLVSWRRAMAWYRPCRGTDSKRRRSPLWGLGPSGSCSKSLWSSTAFLGAGIGKRKSPSSGHFWSCLRTKNRPLGPHFRRSKMGNLSFSLKILRFFFFFWPFLSLILRGVLSNSLRAVL